MGVKGVLDQVDVVALHGFPLDWNHWSIDEWPRKIAEIAAVTSKRIWVTEVGASSFGAEEIQEFCLLRHTSPPKRPEEFADFCAQMTRRYAPG